MVSILYQYSIVFFFSFKTSFSWQKEKIFFFLNWVFIRFILFIHEWQKHPSLFSEPSSFFIVIFFNVIKNSQISKGVFFCVWLFSYQRKTKGKKNGLRVETKNTYMWFFPMTKSKISANKLFLILKLYKFFSSSHFATSW